MKIVKRWTICFVLLFASSSLAAAGCDRPDSAAPGGTGVFTKPVSFSVLQDYDKGESLDEVAKDFQVMQELGVTTWRGSFGWDDYEPTPGRFDFGWLHRFASLACKRGITLRPYLGYTAPWAAKGGTDKEVWNDPPKNLGQWRRFVTTVATEFRNYPNIPSYEIYNEQNVPLWWDGTVAEYAATLAEGGGAIRQVSPRLQVIMGGMVYPDDDWLRQVCSTKGVSRSIDVVPFHAYPETWTPPEITVENFLDQGMAGSFDNSFITALDEACGCKPVWINEAGFATSPGKTEMDQANWWARALATFLAHPRVEHIGIYQIRDRRQDQKVIGESENYYLGITRADRTEKMAFKLLKVLVPLMNSGTLTVADRELDVQVTGGTKGVLHHHLFVRPDKRQLLFIWDRTGSPTVRIGTRPGTTVTEYALDGTTRPFDSFDSRYLQSVRLAAGVVRIFEIHP